MFIYKVFFFYQEDKALYFEKLLKENNLFFERGEENSNKGVVYLFGVRKTDNQKALQLYQYLLTFYLQMLY